MSGTLPTVITAEGLVPLLPDAVRAQLLALVASTNPGYTANLPGSLIEDISSTDVAAILLADAARVELVNSLTPRGANAFLMRQLGAIYGVPLGLGSTTSVQVVFSGPVGFVISQGFIVSDGTYQYVCQRSGVIGSGGTSGEIFALAIDQGTWAVPAATVTQLVTSVPSSIALSVTNPSAGVPGTSAQTEEAYRAQVLQAGRAISAGMPTALRAALEAVSGVQARLISIRQLVNSWQVIVGGGDPYQVANAIFLGLFDISDLVGSTIGITAVTQANPGQVTTDLNHGKITGDVVTIDDVVGMVELNGNDYTVTVISEKVFTIGVNTTSFTAYASGGVVTPNDRNQVVTINDFPDVYEIRYVDPPQQVVSITVTWNTTSTNIVSPAAVAQLAVPALIAYVNSVVVGQPMNLFQLQSVFQVSIESVIPAPLLTRMVFAVSINGVGVSPSAGTGIIAGDPESYFFSDESDITITQG